MRAYSIAPLALRRWLYPIWQRLELELHSDCNRDCGFCPRSGDRSGVRKDASGSNIRKQMPTEKIHSIIEQAARLGFTGKVNLHRLSEGLMDSRYVEIAKFIKSKGMRVSDHTNGDILRQKPELCGELDEIMHQITIGIYDCKTEEECLEEQTFWKNQFKKAKVNFSLPTFHAKIRQNATFYEKCEKDPSVLEQSCERTSALLIRYDGEVSLCCEDDQATFQLGNAFQTSLEEIWWSAKRLDIVSRLKKPGSRHQFDLCSKCYVGGQLVKNIESLPS